MQSYNKLILGLMILLIIPVVVSEASQSTVTCPDYSSTINSLEINLTKNTLLINNLSNDVDYYKNLSEYYKNLYESKEVNITNRELIFLYQNINNLNQNITNLGDEINILQKKLTLFSFEVGISLVSLTAISIFGIELFIRWKQKRKSKQHESQGKGIL